MTLISQALLKSFNVTRKCAATGLFSLVLAVSIFSGCSGDGKKGATSLTGSKTILDAQVLERLPAGALGFVVWEQNSPSFKAMLASPWSKSSFIEKITDPAQVGPLPPDAQKIFKITTALQSAGLISKAGGSPGLVETGFVYLSLGADSAPSAGMLLKLQSTTSSAAKLSELKGILEQNGVTVTDTTVAGLPGFTATIESKGATDDADLTGGANPSADKTFSLIFGGKDHYIAASLESVAAENLLTPPAVAAGQKSAFALLRQSEVFKRAEKAAMVTSDTLTFAFVNVASPLEFIASSVAADKKAEFEKMIKNFPFESAFTNMAFISEKGLNSYDGKMGLVYRPGAEQFRVPSADTLGSSKILSSIPADALGVFSFDASGINGLLRQAASLMPAEEQQQLLAPLALSEGLKGIALAVRNVTGATPFPEIVLVAESSNAAAFKATIKGMISPVAQQAPLSPWQMVDVAGTQFESMMSPLGVGIFLGATSDRVILTSTKGAAEAALAAGKAGDIVGKMEASGKKNAGKDALIMTYVDFKAVHSLVQNMQSTLAMFTGGNNSVDMDSAAELATWGEGIFTLKAKPEAIQFENQLWVKPAQP